MSHEHPSMRVARLKGELKQALLQEGSFCWKKGNFGNALTAYSQFVGLDEWHSAGHHGKGISLIPLRRYKEAVNSFCASIDVSSDNPQAYAGRATAYYLMGEFEKSAVDAEKALRFSPFAPNDSRAAYELQQFGDVILSKQILGLLERVDNPLGPLIQANKKEAIVALLPKLTQPKREEGLKQVLRSQHKEIALLFGGYLNSGAIKKCGVEVEEEINEDIEKIQQSLRANGTGDNFWSLGLQQRRLELSESLTPLRELVKDCVATVPAAAHGLVR